MGEYYDWVNVDRKEYICPNDFGLGNKLTESSEVNNPFLRALNELMANEWKNSRIVFMGDSKELSKDDLNETIKILYNQSVECGCEGCGSDTVVETYRNISGWFSAAETYVRREVEFYLQDVKNGELHTFNEYGVDLTDPYKGLFIRTGTECSYILNHTKKIYCSLVKTRITGTTSEYIDPRPILLRFGIYGTGDWVGDNIGISDIIPDGYKLLEEITIDY